MDRGGAGQKKVENHCSKEKKKCLCKILSEIAPLLDVIRIFMNTDNDLLRDTVEIAKITMHGDCVNSCMQLTED